MPFPHFFEREKIPLLTSRRLLILVRGLVRLIRDSLGIFLSLKFYVKSILEDLKVPKMPFWILV